MKLAVIDKFKAVAFTGIHVQVLPVQVGVIHKLVQVSLRHPHLIFASAKASLWAGKQGEVKRKYKEPEENRNENAPGALGREKESFLLFLPSPTLPYFLPPSTEEASAQERAPTSWIILQLHKKLLCREPVRNKKFVIDITVLGNCILFGYTQDQSSVSAENVFP